MRFLSHIVCCLVCLAFVCVGCSVNLYNGMTSKDFDDANYEEAIKAMDQSNWDTSLVYFGKLSAAYLATPSVADKYAGALAGKCGLDFISFLNSLGGASIGNGTGGTVTLMQFLMNAWTGKTVNPSYCAQAEAVINGISSNPSLRTSGENMFMMILGMAKMGVYLHSKADHRPTSVGDGVIDNTFNACRSNGGAGDVDSLSDNEVKQVVSGFGNFLINFAAFSSSFSGSTSTTITAINTVCNTLSLSICSETNPANVSAGDVKSMRNLMSLDPANATLPGMGLGSGAQAATDPGAGAATAWSCTNAVIANCCP